MLDTPPRPRTEHPHKLSRSHWFTGILLRQLRALAAWLWCRPTLRELRSWRTMLLGAACAVLAIPIVITLTPSIHVQTLGQNIALSARAPSLSLSGYGQITEGPRPFDLPHLHVYGPIQPHLSLTPRSSKQLSNLFKPQSSEKTRKSASSVITWGFLQWYALATSLLLMLTFVLAITLGHLGAQLFGRGHTELTNDRTRRHITLHQVIATLLSVTTLWLGFGSATAIGAHRLTTVSTLTDLFGRGAPVLLRSAPPVGPTVQGYDFAVIGDSRAARVGGPLIDSPTHNDRLCERSKDSLAAEIQFLTDRPTRNLACPSATLNVGLEGEQLRSGKAIPAQLGLLKQMVGLKAVVVMIGPNDLWWSNLLGYCIAQADCNDNLTTGAFESQLNQFTQDYYLRLIPDLQKLPGHPRIIVVTSYSVMAPDATCPDATGPQGMVGLHAAPPGGQPGDKIRMLENRNQELSAVLRAGAEAAGFKVLEPKLKLLCAPDPDGLGPEIQSLTDTNPFHPTGLGSRRLAYEITPLLASSEESSQSADSR